MSNKSEQKKTLENNGFANILMITMMAKQGHITPEKALELIALEATVGARYIKEWSNNNPMLWHEVKEKVKNEQDAA